MAELSTILCGAAGEYFVAAELSRRGYIASVTLRNTRGIDILASNVDASRQVGIQVKSNRGNKAVWILNQKAEEYFADNLFYVFVNLKRDDERPDFYVVPGEFVANSIKERHQKWLNTPGKHGQEHRDSSIRNFRGASDYFERWDLLGL